MTLSEQCQKHGFDYGDFFYHKNELRLRDGDYEVRYIDKKMKYILTEDGIQRMEELRNYKPVNRRLVWAS